MATPVKVEIAADLVKRIDAYLEKNNLGGRGREDGDKSKQRVGLIGELEVHRYLTGAYPDLEAKKGYDGGIDIIHKGKRIDVKTMERKSFVRPDFVNNFYIMQKDYPSDTVVFCSLNSTWGVLEMCGWLPKKELGTRGIFYKAGTVRKRDDGTEFVFRQDNYEVKTKDLDGIETLKNFKEA